MAAQEESGLKGLVFGDGVKAQLLRYAVTGAGVTALQAAIYWLLAGPLAVHPQLANFTGYLAAVASGYVLHGRFSFRGHGGRDRPVARAARFVAVSLVSLGLNAFWVWLWVTHFALPVWAPIPFMGVVTPALVFLLNRQWVFR
ncbi:MAG: GtrA family protein [Sphingobium sp.]|nr:GtrA family protein [Sphingobium sp.]